MSTHRNSHASTAPTSPAIDELRTLILDAESALSNAGDVADEKLVELKEKLQSAIDSTKSTVTRWKNNVVDTGKRADQVVRTHPYESVGIALAAGLILGYALSSRRN